MAGSIQKEDWERFRALGNVPPSIREIVLKSWVRSQRATGIDRLKRAPKVAQDELSRIRARNDRLRQAARAAMGRTGYMLEDSGAMLLLCDRQGVVIDATGDSRILNRGAENHLQLGGQWEEQAIGTNAIGTALHLARPVTISGAEHFCEAIQRWSCAAAPIHDPFGGQLLGAIDISGPADDRMRKAGALSVTLALQIEESLRSAALAEHRALVEALLSRPPGRSGDGVILLDRYGRQVWSSTGGPGLAQRVAGPDAAAWARLVEDSEGCVPRLAEGLRAILAEAEIDLLSRQGEAIGIILTLPRRRPAHRHPSRASVTLGQIAATGPAMATICATAARVVESGVALVLEGPVGAGKETLTRALHAEGPQAALPFHMVDCSLLAASATEAGGLGAGMGEIMLRLAREGGTLCLDEPALTPADAQPRLAQMLGLLERADSGVQLVSLSSATLEERMAAGALSAGLHFRLAGTRLALPALAERRADLPELVRRFAETWSGRRRGHALRFTPAAMTALGLHDWPGNLRELRNLIEALDSTSSSGLIDLADLPGTLTRAPRPGGEDTLRDHERAEILRAIAEARGNMTAVARRLGIARSTLYLKLDQHGIARPARA